MSVLALVLASALVAPVPAAAAEFDSQFAGESAFLTLSPGQTGTFTVFFQNTGTGTWAKGTSTQVDLASCRSDQVTCDSRESTIATFDPGTWLGPTRYAAQAQGSVAPGSIATFSYGVRVPAAQGPGRYRFNGDLVVSTTGRTVHAEGYYHDLTVPASSCVPAIITGTPSFIGVQVGREHALSITVTCADGSTRAANTTVQVTVPSENVAGNPTMNLTAITDASGVATVRWTRSNPSIERVTFTPAGLPNVTGTATVRWIVPDVAIACTPSDANTLGAGTSRLHTVTAKDPRTGAAFSGTVGVTITSALTFPASLSINGTSAIDRTPGSAIVSLTVSTGSVSFFVSGTSGTIRPRVYLEENSSGTLDVTELFADCGATTFGAP